MNFDEALRYLLSLGHETLAMKLGLDNIKRLLRRLGDPQRSYAAVQLAGTNGKGSTAVMLDSICRRASLNVGLYTSPHLISVTERIRINGFEIAPAEFARLATRVRREAEALERESGALPTFFEQVTTLALVAFREQEVDLAILETGLGGRLDATTAAEAKTIAVTPISIDHQEHLGETLEEIAAEKAAIIRKGARAIIAPQAPVAREVIERRCRECNVTPRFVSDEVGIKEMCGDGRLRVTIKSGQEVYEDVRLGLRGRHQAINAAVAAAVAEELRTRGFAISRASIIEGLEAARHAGRLEKITCDSHVYLLDGAHNAAGAEALRTYIDEFVRVPVTIIFAAMNDKDLTAIINLLFPVARRLILTQIANPRAATPETLARHVPPHGGSSRIVCAPNSSEALRVARALTPLGETICVTGSLYLIGEIRSLLAERCGRIIDSADVEV
ncbi:MAG: bifunctional folylpolyglutamate synthase/dihydrofolate synthase [Pyrinomonadaceae bacterium]|nr:bifunctional folylpolyglutamate synthase/dihydrofolate synthase [Pyrinomonadaceae bacterium]